MCEYWWPVIDTSAIGMESKIRNVVKYTLSLLLAAIMLWFCFKGVNWQDFAANLKDCRWEWVAVSILAGVLSNWFRAERWRELLLPLDGRTGRLTVFNAVNIAYLANFVFPRIGELVRCGVVSGNVRRRGAEKDDTGKNGTAETESGDMCPSGNMHSSVDMPSSGGKSSGDTASGSSLGYDSVLGTVVTERSIDLLMMFGILLVFLAFKWDEFGSFFVEKIWVPASGRLDFSIWWTVLIPVLIIAVFSGLLVYLRRRTHLAARLRGIMQNIWQGIVSCFKMKHAGRFILNSLLIWLMYFFMSYSSMRAVPLLDSLGFADAMFLMLAGSLGWLVPVPGGFGAFHYIVALALSSVYSLPFELGIIFATISHESQSLMMAVTGMASYISEMLLTRRTAG